MAKVDFLNAEAVNKLLLLYYQLREVLERLNCVEVKYTYCKSWGKGTKKPDQERSGFEF